MDGRKEVLSGFHKELLRFIVVMEELRLLRLVCEDLKSFRRMLKLKKYD